MFISRFVASMDYVIVIFELVMYSNMRATRGQEIILAAIEKAWSDAEFKTRLLQSPLESLSELSEGAFEVPFDYTIEFVYAPEIDISDNNGVQLTQELPGRILRVNIPKRPDLASIRLTDEQLEVVAAGVKEYGPSKLTRYMLLPLIFYP